MIFLIVFGPCPFPPSGRGPQNIAQGLHPVHWYVTILLVCCVWCLHFCRVVGRRLLNIDHTPEMRVCQCCCLELNRPKSSVMFLYLEHVMEHYLGVHYVTLERVVQWTGCAIVSCSSRQLRNSGHSAADLTVWKYTET